MEVVLPPQFCLGLLVLVGEEGLEAGAEVDMPAPEAAEDRFGILVVVRPELAVLARVLCHNKMGTWFKVQMYEFFSGYKTAGTVLIIRGDVVPTKPDTPYGFPP